MKDLCLWHVLQLHKSVELEKLSGKYNYLYLSNDIWDALFLLLHFGCSLIEKQSFLVMKVTHTGYLNSYTFDCHGKNSEDIFIAGKMWSFFQLHIY